MKKKGDEKKTAFPKEGAGTGELLQQLQQCRAEFAKARSRYKKLLDSTPDAMLFANSRSEIVLVNAQFEKIFGYSREEIIGKKMDTLIPQRFRKSHSRLVQRFFKDPGTRAMGSHLEISAARKDGTEFSADVSLSPLQTDDELLVTAAVRDITERKEAETQIELDYYIQKVTNSMLKVSLEPLPLEEQFDRILDLILNVPSLSLQEKGAIFLKEPDTEVLVLKAQHGFTPENPLPCIEVPLGRCLCGKAAAMAKLLYAENINSFHEIHDPDIFPHGHYCVPILSGHKLHGLLNVYLQEGHKRSSREEDFLTAVSSTLAFIIERNRAKGEKKELQRQLARAEKLAALGRFTANVAHEIRNPLTSVGGFARRLAKAARQGSKEKEYTGIIIAEVTRLEKILNNILSFSGEPTPSYTENDLAGVIDQVLQMNENLFAGSNIVVRRDLGDIAAFFFDRDMLIEALENIFLNAMDAMPEGGSLTISASLQKEGGRQTAVIRVRDTGRGISREDMEIIFEPFYTTKAAEHGTGLGLAITRKNLESLQGTVEVESEEGKGTVVILSLPFLQQLP